MSTPTYELAESNGSPVIRCLFCGAESDNQENVGRLYCSRCSWFHEPADENRSQMLLHIQTALSAVTAALDLGDGLTEVDPALQDRLRSAQHDLRRALSRS